MARNGSRQNHIGSAHWGAPKEGLSVMFQIVAIALCAASAVGAYWLYRDASAKKPV